MQTNAPSILSGIFTQAAARSALNLGTIATQNSSSVAITGGAISGTTVGGWSPAFGLSDTGNSIANGGSGFAIGDSVTVSGGAVIGVTNVSGGAITSITVNIRGNNGSLPANPVAMTSTSGSGTGATFNLAWAPLAAGILSGTLTGNSGNLFVGGETPNALFGGSECTFIGDRAGGNLIGASFGVVAIGHNACGIGGGTQFALNNSVFIGEDAGRNVASGANGNVVIGSTAAQNISSNLNVIVGSNAGPVVTSTSQSTIIGAGAGGIVGGAVGLTTGSGNTLIGCYTGVTGAAVTCSVIIGGRYAGGGQAGAMGGSTSVIVGAGAGNPSLTGTNNVILGYNMTVPTLRTGGYNIIIGNNGNIDANSATDQQAIVIGTNGGLKTLGSNTINIEGVIKATGTGTPVNSNVLIAGSLSVSGQTTTITSGSGAPGSTQPNGSIYLRTDGGLNSRLYVSQGGGVWSAVTIT